VDKKESYTIDIDEEVIKPKVKTPAMEGVPWEELQFKVNAKSFAELMRGHGLLTYQDVRTNTQQVVGLLQRLYKVDLGTVLAFAREHEEVNDGK